MQRLRSLSSGKQSKCVNTTLPGLEDSTLITETNLHTAVFKNVSLPLCP